MHAGQLFAFTQALPLVARAACNQQSYVRPGTRTFTITTSTFPPAKAQSERCTHPRGTRHTRRMFARLLALAPFAPAALTRPLCAWARGVRPNSLPSEISSFPASWPYFDEDFTKVDTAPDAEFYSFPRIAAHHIDDDAVTALRTHMAHVVNSEQHPVRDVLDLCASFESYVPNAWPGRRRVAGLGMNAAEMETNSALTERAVIDLNDPRAKTGDSPLLPYGDEAFDSILCALSIDYLTQPREVLRECARVLRPGGVLTIAFGDRLFATKAVSIWTGSGDEEHIEYVCNAIHFSGGQFDDRMEIIDLSPRKSAASDPLYAVQVCRRKK
jgi:SAM-dependent methyltransferase